MPHDFSHPHAQPFDLPAGDTAILLIHGFTGSPSHMRLLGDAAQVAGFTARGILLPGHGTTIEDMEKSGDMKWLDACRAAYLEMEKKYRRVAVAGLSMGGALSMILAAEFKPSAMILFAPAVMYRSRVNHLSPVAKHFMRVSRWRESGLRDEDFLYDYHIGYDGAPVAKVEDLSRIQRLARAGMPQIDCPALVFQSHRDESVHASVPDRIMRGISSQIKEICWVDRSRHVCTIGPDRAYINSRAIDFLRRYGV